MNEITKIFSADGSIKYAFRLENNLKTEAAYFKVSGRERPNIACVSTQVGCSVGCTFCATAKTSFFRNLTKDEIFLQISSVIDNDPTGDALAEGFEVSFMGMGEPLSNLKNVLEAVKEIHIRYPLINRVSLSTSGTAKRIDALTDAMPISPPIHLQISLHTTEDSIRKRLIPYSSSSIESLLKAGRRYHEKTGDKVCLNYILLKGINDFQDNARWLAGLDSSVFYVKLTALNLVPDMPKYLLPVSVSEMLSFSNILASRGMPHKIFVGDGLDVQASCGQLSATPREIGVSTGMS
jgi:23S rRNA (adenine2503-C2)-methyltransferase